MHSRDGQVNRISHAVFGQVWKRLTAPSEPRSPPLRRASYLRISTCVRSSVMQSVATTRDISATVLMSRLQAKPMPSFLSRVYYISLLVIVAGVVDHVRCIVRAITISAYETSRSFDMAQTSRLGEMILQAVGTIRLILCSALGVIISVIGAKRAGRNLVRVSEICRGDNSKSVVEIHTVGLGTKNERCFCEWIFLVVLNSFDILESTSTQAR